MTLSSSRSHKVVAPKRWRWVVLVAILSALGLVVYVDSLKVVNAETIAAVNSVALLAGDADSRTTPILLFECTGFLIDDHTVVSAAHCVEERMSVTVAHGSLDLCDNSDWQRTTMRVDRRIPEVDLVFLTSTNPLAPGASATIAEAAGGKLVVAGWQQNERTGPVQCQQTRTTLSDCFSDESLVCSFDHDEHVCGGLSGAAALTEDGAVVGVVSASEGCQGGDAYVAPIRNRALGNASEELQYSARR